MLSLICFILAALLCFLVGFDVVNPTKYDLVVISIGLIALGLALRGIGPSISQITVKEE